ncbi:MAG: hypothetical protein IJD92_03720 [Bacilli bacterium]|nr:hypothetical protein [Bacilli bacterium]
MQDLNIYNESYLIIGGPNTKKSEVALNLSKKLKYKLINLDREKHKYFDDFTDYDFKTYQNILDNYGIEKAINYIHKYEMKHLNYILDNIDRNVIIDFGNTYTLINDKEILNKIKLYKNIVLLNPSEELINKSDIITKKLYNNKINKEISTININIDNKEINEIIEEIINYKKFKDIL